MNEKTTKKEKEVEKPEWKPNWHPLEKEYIRETGELPYQEGDNFITKKHEKWLNEKFKQMRKETEINDIDEI